jgi:hypothetical protein
MFFFAHSNRADIFDFFFLSKPLGGGRCLQPLPGGGRQVAKYQKNKGCYLRRPVHAQGSVMYPLAAHAVCRSQIRFLLRGAVRPLACFLLAGKQHVLGIKNDNSSTDLDHQRSVYSFVILEMYLWMCFDRHFKSY